MAEVHRGRGPLYMTLKKDERERDFPHVTSRRCDWWRLGGGGVEESQDLDVKVGILGQNQSNALRKHILLMLITEHEEKNVPQ